MNMQLFKTEHLGFRICSIVEMSPAQIAEFAKIIETSSPLSQDPLHGRVSPSFGEISQLGRVVVKRYVRGGLIGKLIQQHISSFGFKRAKNELNMLLELRRFGISVPKPIACACRSGLLSESYLIMHEISNHRSLAGLSNANTDILETALFKTASEVSKLIKHHILHVDLHPGNVLLNDQLELFLIDFDKAKFIKGSKNKLRDYYLRRWRRAVLKHNLPDYLAELLSAGLRKNFDD